MGTRWIILIDACFFRDKTATVHCAAQHPRLGLHWTPGPQLHVRPQAICIDIIDLLLFHAMDPGDLIDYRPAAYAYAT
jgi:hypothetical protein